MRRENPVCLFGVPVLFRRRTTSKIIRLFNNRMKGEIILKTLLKVSYREIPALLVLVALLLTTLVSCAPATPLPAPAVDATPVPNYAGKKILYVNSYHEGYPWSDGIENGLHEVLDGTGVELKIVYLDTKQNPDVAFGQSSGLKAKTEIETFKPDVVIASDDNAQKYVIVPYYNGTDLPVIFNGVNWDASAYKFADNVTGMIEVELPDQLINLLKVYAKGDRLGYITVDTETERKVVDIYNQRFFNGKLKPYWVKTQDEFKDAFLAAQDEVDILFMGNNAGSDKWDEAEMKEFILENSTIPTGSINDWMAPYTLLTLAKSAKEQGLWSAQAALSILDGKPASEIPLAENKKGELMVNLDMADKLAIVFAPSLLKNAAVILENITGQ
jgi:ABC-type uncharacterized transport system substrate-binding protein